MTDKFTKSVEGEKGNCDIYTWTKANVTDVPASTKGPKVEAKTLDGKTVSIGINGVGILFQNCKFLRTGTSDNYGAGGSNCPTGDPVCFVEIKSVLPEAFNSSRKGILAKCEGDSYVLPLCQIGTYPELLNAMNDMYAQFIAQKRGDNKHDETHIANGICTGLAAVCYALSKEITLNGKKPDKDRLHFLVESLHALAITAHSVAVYSQKCKNIFRLMPYVARTADTFQSVLMAFIFDEMPCEAIRVKLVGSSIFRNFNNTIRNSPYASRDPYRGRGSRRTWDDVDFTKETPVGLIGLLLIAPMLAGMISSELETSALINKIIRSINTAIEGITTQLVTKEKELGQYALGFKQKLVHVRNKHILLEFAKATEVPWIDTKYVDKIYDAVLLGQKDIAKAIGVAEHSSFVRNQELFLNGDPMENFPVMVKQESISDQKTSVGESGSYIPGDPREWTAISLMPGVYKVQAKPVGIAEFKTGRTAGDQFVANVRFTSGVELMKGSYPGYAITGMYYDPSTKRFTERKYAGLDVNGEFLIKCTHDGITVSQKSETDEIKVLQIKTDKEGTYPLVAFKYCILSITLVEKAVLTKPATFVKPGVSYSSILSKTKPKPTTGTVGTDAVILPDSKNPDDGEIETVRSLTEGLESLHTNIRVTPLRRASYSSYGQETAKKLTYGYQKCQTGKQHQRG
jgi:hypothetical protein